MAGGKLKARGTTYWFSPNEDATNESGFSALPGGYRSINGSFNSIRLSAFFWSATESDSASAWGRDLDYEYGSVYWDGDDYGDKSVGASVRCRKD